MYVTRSPLLTLPASTSVALDVVYRLPLTGEVMAILGRLPDPDDFNAPNREDVLYLEEAALASPLLARSETRIKKLTSIRSHAATPTGNPAVIGIPLDR